MSPAPATTLFEAIQQGDEPRVVGLLTTSPDLVWAADPRKRTALHVAAEHDRDRIAALLIEAGADPSAVSADGLTPLQCAEKAGSSKVATLLSSSRV
jgi:ankyrin repeat protein